MVTEVSVTAEVLERLAFHSGADIDMGAEPPVLVLDGVTYRADKAVAS